MVGGGGWLEKLRIRLSQLPTKLKLKLKLSLATSSVTKIRVFSNASMR